MEDILDLTNVVILQHWSYSIREGEEVIILNDGSSLHRDKSTLDNYIDSVYKERKSKNYIPFEYERIIGKPIAVFISKELRDKVDSEGSIRLTQVEMNNLLTYKKIDIS